MGLSRSKRPRRKRKYKTVGDLEASNRRAFHEAAWKQRCCAVCGKGGSFQSHHVVEKQKLRIIGRLDLVWDTRNALRVCGDCHDAHTIGFRRINLDRLTDENYEFAWFVLRAEAADYLRRKYNGSDQRWADLLLMCDAEIEDARESA